jgi:hypothetical protein
MLSIYILQNECINKSFVFFEELLSVLSYKVSESYASILRTSQVLTVAMLSFSYWHDVHIKLHENKSVFSNDIKEGGHEWIHGHDKAVFPCEISTVG